MGQAAIFDHAWTTPTDGPASYDPVRSELAALRQAIGCIPDGMVITAQSRGSVACRGWFFANAAFSRHVGLSGRRRNQPAYVTPPSRRLSSRRRPALDQPEEEPSKRWRLFGRDILPRQRWLSDAAAIFVPNRFGTSRGRSRIASRSSATTRSGPNIEDLIRRNERLACIGLLAAGIAHEINNPTGAGPAGGRNRLGHQGLCPMPATS